MSVSLLNLLQYAQKAVQRVDNPRAFLSESIPSLCCDLRRSADLTQKRIPEQQRTSQEAAEQVAQSTSSAERELIAVAAMELLVQEVRRNGMPEEPHLRWWLSKELNGATYPELAIADNVSKAEMQAIARKIQLVVAKLRKAQEDATAAVEETLQLALRQGMPEEPHLRWWLQHELYGRGYAELALVDNVNTDAVAAIVESIQSCLRRMRQAEPRLEEWMIAIQAAPWCLQVGPVSE